MSDTTPKYETAPAHPATSAAPPEPPTWDRDGPWRILSRTTWIEDGRVWERVVRSKPMEEER